jgi:energy-coupling factor transporter ATP-binding protein EcfA2
VALSRAARDGLELAAEQSPFVDWRVVRPRLERTWKPGQHVGIFGPNGYGKSTVARELGELSTQPVILFITKKRDRLLSELPRRGWVLCRTLEQVETALRAKPAERYFGKRAPAGPPPRIVYWPPATGGLRQRRAKLRTLSERLLDFVYDRGGVTLIIDEGLFLTKTLGQSEQVEMLLHEVRSSGSRLVILSQRPSGLPLSAYSAPTLLVMFATNEPADLKRLSEIGGGVDPRPLRTELQLLPMYQFVLVAPRTKPAWSLRSAIPPD